eukprot:TRINITY_DN41381_c0_g2_i1.p1 TRINITY_DN41381_c0_g2~~TRINITY_DN41381_c0_g2_i1.p1  ORF type:complete len:360 (+),score=33.75 TRINITY_DN41381_c0_g2_i1:35-1081(+)
MDLEKIVQILSVYKFFEFKIGQLLDQKLRSLSFEKNTNVSQISELLHFLTEIQFYDFELFTRIQNRIFELKNQLNADNVTKIVRGFARSGHIDQNLTQKLSKLTLFLIKQNKINISQYNFCVLIQQFSLLYENSNLNSNSDSNLDSNLNSNEQFWIEISDYFRKNYPPEKLSEIDLKNIYFSNLIRTTKNSKKNWLYFQQLPRKIKNRAHETWIQEQNKITTISQFQLQVFKYLNQLNLNPQLEYKIFGQSISLDICLKKYKIAIMIDGPYHFRSDGNLMGSSLCRNQMLKNLGWHVVNIPYFEWENLTSQIQKFEYLKLKLIEIQTCNNNSPVGDKMDSNIQPLLDV